MSKNSNEENILTRKGCKNTKSRRAVIEVLENAQMPLSVEDIFIKVKEAGNGTNLSTVYRILELMENMRLVNKTIFGDGKSRYELSVDGHRHHLICTNCSKTVPIEGCPLAQLEKDVGNKTKFHITGHRLELYGLCPKCKGEF